MTGVQCVLGLWAGLLGFLTPGDAEPRYVASRHVLLTCTPAGDSQPTQVELWVSDDDGQTWQSAAAERLGATTLRYTAPADGHYAFYLVLKNPAGSSSDPPQPGVRPQARVIVDTLPPTLQLHAAVINRDDGVVRKLRLRATLLDENPGRAGLRVFYRAADDTEWLDGGTAPLYDGELTWPIPAGAPGPLDLRVVATDLAGNRAMDELRGVAGENEVPAEPREGEAPAEPSLTAIHVQPVVPISADKIPPAVAPDVNRTSRQLRDQARQLMQQRRYALAAARLEDAAQRTPADADLLSELGSALYSAGKYDDATTRFEAALKLTPDGPNALEGLALVAATQRRYPQAREHLLHLLRVSPQSAANWLRLGDIEHQLGNADEAATAWQHVLDIQAADRAVRDKAEKRLKLLGPARAP